MHVLGLGGGSDAGHIEDIPTHCEDVVPADKRPRVGVAGLAVVARAVVVGGRRDRRRVAARGDEVGQGCPTCLQAHSDRGKRRCAPLSNSRRGGRAVHDRARRSGHERREEGGLSVVRDLEGWIVRWLRWYDTPSAPHSTGVHRIVRP